MNALSEADRNSFQILKNKLSSYELKFQRNMGYQTLYAQIEEIRRFCIRGDSDDWKRCYICGIFWDSDRIAINTRKLGVILSRCKSSINGCLQKMGYSATHVKAEKVNLLHTILPILEKNRDEVKYWSLRTKICEPVPLCAVEYSSSPHPLNNFTKHNRFRKRAAKQYDNECHYLSAAVEANHYNYENEAISQSLPTERACKDVPSGGVNESEIPFIEDDELTCFLKEWTDRGDPHDFSEMW